MRKITQNAANAFIAGRAFASGNTTVTVNSEGYISMYLHGNLIAKRGMCDTDIEVSLAGWPTVTTRERINGLLTTMGSPCIVFQKNHQQYFGNANYSEPVSDIQWIAA